MALEFEEEIDMERIDQSARVSGEDSQPDVVRRPRYPAEGSHRFSASLATASATGLAQRLGWLSLSLGFAEIVAPRLVLRLLGGNGRYANLVRLYGVRELLSGALMFAQGTRPATAMWSRVAGDALDIATLAAAGASPRTNKGGVALATAGVLGVAALDVHCARELRREHRESQEIRMTRSIVVNRPPHELYAFWRAFENFPRFMYHMRSVTPTGPACRIGW
ncbi:MAG TPA: hypothetical protein VKV24_08655 [Casimicrobiaceae bacterium]|nr:hypothetical protein [Casimicrobiaceae bacterium]